MGLQIAKLMKYYMPSQCKKEEKSLTGTVQLGINTDAEQYMENYMKSVGKAFQTEPKNVQTFISARSHRGDQLVMEAHIKAREIIRKISPGTKVGLTLSLFDYQPVSGGENRSEKEWEDDFKHYLPAIRDDDFLGVQNYTRKLIGKDGDLEPAEGVRLTLAGYEFYPEALGHVIRHVAEDWEKPIFVTENGIATNNDEERVEYISEALKGVQSCINEGINVKAYLHWSLMDNYEWQAGYSQTFGLIAVDRTTMERKQKPSFSFLGGVAQKREV